MYRHASARMMFIMSERLYPPQRYRLARIPHVLSVIIRLFGHVRIGTIASTGSARVFHTASRVADDVVKPGNT